VAVRFANRNQELDYQHNVSPAGKAAFQAERDRSGGRLTYAQWKARNAGNRAYYGVGAAAPAPGPGAAAAVPAVPPHLTPAEQAEYNREYFGIAGDRINVEQDWQAALANDPLIRAQIDLQYRRGVRTSGENVASRGMEFSGIADSAMWDLGRVKELSEVEHQNALDSARRRYDAITGNLNQRGDALELWKLDAARANAMPGVPGAVPPAGARPAPVPAAPAAQPRPPGAGPPGPNYHWTGKRWVPIGKPVPAAHGSFASGPPPSPNHAWDGTRWVKVR
jgi:hypothetical protein